MNQKKGHFFVGVSNKINHLETIIRHKPTLDNIFITGLSLTIEKSLSTSLY